MTESSSQTSPQDDVAQAVDDLSRGTRELVRNEISLAQREMLAKARQSAPAFLLAGAAAVSGSFALASCYRLSHRLLEKRLPPASAAFIAVLAYGGAAAACGVYAARRIRELPPPFPSDTVRHASRSVSQAAESRLYRTAMGTRGRQVHNL